MPFSNNSVTRDKLDAYEGATLKNHSSTTTLGLADNDDDMASEAQTEVKLDLLDRTDKAYYNETYESRDALLDALDAVDDDGMIETLMAFKFLEYFFGDQAIGELDGGDKAIFYERKYNNKLPQVVSYLTSRLDPPQTPNVVKFSR